MKTIGLHIIIIITLVFMVSGIIFAEENLIKNPSFEDIGTGDIPKNWRTHSWTPDASGGQFGIDKEIAHSGKHSVFVFNSVDNHGYYLQTVTVKENSFYKLSCWVKTENIKENLEGAGISI
ncbi:MAG: hypothetical protein JXJ04_24615, partial [Spirochaetales bacterium]|nr:hypothetical protein [Spirochaetales bacterium]